MRRGLFSFSSSCTKAYTEKMYYGEENQLQVVHVGCYCNGQLTWMSREKLSLSQLPFVPFGLEEFEEADEAVAVGTYPWVACSHFSRRSASREKSGCLTNKYE